MIQAIAIAAAIAYFVAAGLLARPLMHRQAMPKTLSFGLATTAVPNTVRHAAKGLV